MLLSLNGIPGQKVWTIDKSTTKGRPRIPTEMFLCLTDTHPLNQRPRKGTKHSARCCTPFLRQTMCTIDKSTTKVRSIILSWKVNFPEWHPRMKDKTYLQVIKEQSRSSSWKALSLQDIHGCWEATNRSTSHHGKLQNWKLKTLSLHGI